MADVDWRYSRLVSPLERRRMGIPTLEERLAAAVELDPALADAMGLPAPSPDGEADDE